MCAPADPVLDRQLALLDRLAERGVRIAESIQLDAAEAAMAFARVSRAVRQTLLLQSRLRADARTGHGWDARARKARVERIVTRVIDDEIEDTDEAVALVLETSERLEGDDIYGDVMSMPVPDLVARICHDLGLQPDWDVLNQEAWAQEESEASNSMRPPPLAGEVARSDGGGIPPPLIMETPGAGERPLSHGVTAPPRAEEQALWPSGNPSPYSTPARTS